MDSTWSTLSMMTNFSDLAHAADEVGAQRRQTSAAAQCHIGDLQHRTDRVDRHADILLLVVCITSRITMQVRFDTSPPVSVRTARPGR